MTTTPKKPGETQDLTPEMKQKLNLAAGGEEPEVVAPLADTEVKALTAKEVEAIQELKSLTAKDVETVQELDKVLATLDFSSDKTLDELVHQSKVKKLQEKAKHQSKSEEKFRRQEREHDRNYIAKVKAEAIEQCNRKCLVLFRSTNNFWKMGWVSALEYYYNISKRIGRLNTNLNTDGDFFAKSPDGIVSIRDLKRFDTDLEKIGIKLIKEDDCLRIYHLGYAISSTQIAEMRNKRKGLEERANRNIVSKNCHPNIYADCKNLLKFTHYWFGRMTPVNREFIGSRIVLQVQKIYICYLNVCEGIVSLVDGYREIDKVLIAMKHESGILMETQILKLKTCIEYQEKIIELHTLVRKELQREEKRLEKLDANGQK